MFCVYATACADVARVVDADHTSERQLEAAFDTELAECVMPKDRGRGLGATSVPVIPELTINVGDTARLAELWSRETASGLPATVGWRTSSDDVARLEGDLLIPVRPGQAVLKNRVDGRTLCARLTTAFAGVALSAITVERPLVELSSSGTARVQAVIRYTNGLAVPVHEAAVWQSLDPSVAEISAGAWVTPRRDGIARITAAVGSLRDTVTVVVGDQRMLALAPQAAGGFINSIGVNLHLNYFDLVYGYGYYSIVIPRLRELGVRHVRDNGIVLPDNLWMDRVYTRWHDVAALANAKFTVVLSPKRLHSGPGTNFRDMTHIVEIVDRVGAENIDAWEGINEHDISGHVNFANEVRDMQRSIYTLVKANPLLRGHRVLGPSFAFPYAAQQVGDLSGFMDAGSIHPYDGGNVPTTNLWKHTDSVVAVTGTKPLQATEIGYHTAWNSGNPWHFSLTEVAHAKYTLRQFFEMYNKGIERSFVYELIDIGPDLSDVQQNFGLLRLDGSPKPAFNALRDMIALLSDRDGAVVAPRELRVRFTGDTVGIHRLTLQKSDGRRYLVLWQNALSYNKASMTDIDAPAKPLVVDFAEQFSTINVYLPLDGKRALATSRQSRQVSILVPDHPVIIELVN